jgi:hypothetical protein
MPPTELKAYLTTADAEARFDAIGIAETRYVRLPLFWPDDVVPNQMDRSGLLAGWWSKRDTHQLPSERVARISPRGGS